MLKVMAFTVELKYKVLGCTSMVMPMGGSTRAMYFEFTGPTFVTVLTMIADFPRDGMVMEGRFMSSREGRLVGQETGYSVSREMLELLKPMPQRY